MKNDLPKGWTIGVFKDLAYIEMGQSPEGSTYNSDMVGMPLLNGPTEFTERYPRKIQWTSKPSKICNEGDILICVRGSSTGRINISNDRYCIGRGVAAIRGNEKSLTLFLEYLIQYVVQKILILSSGSTFPSVDKATLSTIPINIPPFSEQQKIAQILSTWDEAIQTTQHLLDKLESRKKGIMERVLRGKMLEIGQIATQISVRNKADKTLPVLSCTKYNGLVDSLEYFGRKIYSDDTSTYKIVSKNTFAYATNHIEEGSIGYQSKYVEALISPMYTVFETNELINDSFLFYVLKSDKYIKIYQQNMAGSIDRRGALRWNDFSKIKIPFPSLEEQTAIAKILNTAETEIQETKAYLKTLKHQKKGLMQQLLTGKIIVKTDG